MSGDQLFTLSMVVIGALVAVFGTLVLTRARRTGIVQMFGVKVTQESWTAYQASVAITAFVTVVAFLAILLVVGIWLAMGSSDL